MKNFSNPFLYLSVLCFHSTLGKYVYPNALTTSTSKENCNIKLRQKYCLEDANCLRCDVGPKCHAKGKRKVSESNDGTFLLRGKYILICHDYNLEGSGIGTDNSATLIPQQMDVMAPMPQC